jgi:hypothetical protein
MLAYTLKMLTYTLVMLILKRQKPHKIGLLILLHLTSYKYLYKDTLKSLDRLSLDIDGEDR